MVRIRSEHAIGFLKGRFQSLKGLRVLIRDENTHKFATYWILACLGIHSFAMKCEEEEKSSSGHSDNSFIAQGLSSSSDDTDERPLASTSGPLNTHSTPLQAGHAFREDLKKKLLEAKETRAYHREHRNQGHITSSEESE